MLFLQMDSPLQICVLKISYEGTEKINNKNLLRLDIGLMEGVN